MTRGKGGEWNSHRNQGGGKEIKEKDPLSSLSALPLSLPIFLFPTEPNSIQFRAAPRSIIDSASSTSFTNNSSIRERTLPSFQG